jgi:raffinose/stachyose/melibiose transport system permease protein
MTYLHPPRVPPFGGILIAVVPILLAYTILQRWIVGGLTAGATKG